MRFSKEKFLSTANSFERKAYSKHIEEMDGKEVVFKRDCKYGEVALSKEEYVYPVRTDWSVEE